MTPPMTEPALHPIEIRRRRLIYRANHRGTFENDLLIGGIGNDAIYCGSGDNTVWGGAGNDYISSGMGANKFMYHSSGDGADIIVKWNPNDTIHFANMTANAVATQVTIADSGADTLITVNDESIRVIGVHIDHTHVIGDLG